MARDGLPGSVAGTLVATGPVARALATAAALACAALILMVLGSGGAAASEATPVTFVDLRTGQWFLQHSDGTEVALYYGAPGDQPLMGDWDCDGTATPGAYRASDGFVYLRNTLDTGPGTIRFFLGMAGDVALAGDFNGDGCDSVSIYRPSEGRVYVSNSLGSEEGYFTAEADYFFGVPGDRAFVGDFDGDGIDTVGLHRASTGFVYFTDEHAPAGFAETSDSFFYGDPGDLVTAGDWSGDGTDTVAILRRGDGRFYARNTNSQGPADVVVSVPGDGLWVALSGAGVGGSIGSPSPSPPSPTPPPAPPPPPPPIPTGPIEIFPGDPLADLVGASPPGTEFIIKAGVHVGHVMYPAADMKFLGEPGAVLDGNGVQLNAFAGDTGRDRVEIRGLEIRNYRVGVFDGAISARQIGDLSAEGVGWIVADNNIHSNGGAGINLGTGMTVVNNSIHDNQQIGISGLGSEEHPITDVTITGNTIFRNSTNPDFVFEHHEGGIKTTFTSSLVVEDNEIYDNGGVAMYCDILCNSVVVTGNRMYDNWGRANGGGVFLEISDGLEVTNNYFGPGGHLTYPYTIYFFGGITIGESHNGYISGNEVEVDTAAGIVVRNCCSHEREPSSGIVIENNVVRSINGGPVTVGLTDGNSNVGDISYRGNTYQGDIRFYWNGGWLGFDQWQGMGQDTTGSFG